MKNKSFLKIMFFWGAGATVIVFTVLMILFLLRKEKVGESWFYINDDGEYVVMYHGRKYVPMDKEEYYTLADALPYNISEEYLTCGEPDFGDYFKLGIMYSRICLVGNAPFPEYIELHYSWDGGVEYLKRMD